MEKPINSDDKRQEFRQDNKLTVIIELDSADNGEPILAVRKSLDISANGLRAITYEAVTTDSILRCCIRDEKSDRQFLLVSEVKWCRHHANGDYLIGLSLFDSDGTDIVEWKEYITQSRAA